VRSGFYCRDSYLLVSNCLNNAQYPLRTGKSETLKAKTTIFHQAQTTNKVKDEVNMTVAKQITRPTPYASSEDFSQVFDEHMNSLYLLAFLLTADQKKVEQCFVSGLEDAVEGSPVFKEWAHSWARRAVILNAVRVLSPRPADGNDRGQSSSDAADSNGRALSDGQRAEIAAILELKPFERFAYVITVLERYSDQECSVLLGCTRRDVLAARVRALKEVGGAMETRYQQLPSASPNNPALRERLSSALQLLATPRLATSS
jgi:DNA-directed RNA polymerase specialized sigma24 family protein